MKDQKQQPKQTQAQKRNAEIQYQKHVKNTKNFIELYEKKIKLLASLRIIQDDNKENFSTRGDLAIIDTRKWLLENLSEYLDILLLIDRKLSKKNRPKIEGDI